MIVKGKTGVQRRKLRSDGWTVALRAQFLDVLAATCNITTACRAVGKSADSARALKKRDGEFAMLWAEAYAAGRERLEEELVACALGQVPSGYNPTDERAEPAPMPFNPELALKVLALQNGTHHKRRRAGRPPAQTDVDQALLKRLEGLAAKVLGS